MIKILMISPKMATPGLLKINDSWRLWRYSVVGYDVIISVHDVTKEILSRDSNYSVNVVMWSKFYNSRISVRDVIITSIL